MAPAASQSTPAPRDHAAADVPAALRPWIERVATVPHTDAYPGVDELLAGFRALATRYPERVGERRIGTSTLGEPLPCFTVRADSATDRAGADETDRGSAARTADGEAPPHYVVVGGVHPNEPVGAVTALHLATALCEDDALREHFGGVWDIVPCIDPDGARLNEGWFHSPADKRLYGRHFYRPPGDRQVEWTFPFAYRDAYFDRVLPETFALMRLIDATRPRFLTTLHNCEAGGVYYYLNRPSPELYPLLEAIPTAAGIPLATGEPEAAHAPRYAPSVYGCIDMRDAYDYLDSLGADPADEIAGASSAAYAEPYGTFYFVTEVPHWSHPEADDETPVRERHADVIRERAEGFRATGEVLGRLLDTAAPQLTLPTPFLAAVRDFVPSLTKIADLETSRAEGLPDRPATVSERYACRHSVHCFRVRVGGMLLRALGAEITAGTASPEVRACHTELLEVYAVWEAEAAPVTGDPLPIATLAGVQYAALLAAADHSMPGGAPAPEPADRT
ncbi:peptidase M14 [Streptomyces armeniacus]|uniref:Peptidase M14 n=1 Tax=Streptomyces armeniacus TaxID=83291 RepID=A0A345XTP4_9ACTN|nr:M14 family zinc carboxypeptidase [Streptomyces armeniacus]AXK35010.1 peptidase M14 [Streptomyces armeniacus]